MNICKITTADKTWLGKWSNGKSCLESDESKCCSFYGTLPSLISDSEWLKNGPYWHVPKMSRKVTKYEK